MFIKCEFKFKIYKHFNYLFYKELNDLLTLNTTLLLLLQIYKFNKFR